MLPGILATVLALAAIAHLIHLARQRRAKAVLGKAQADGAVAQVLRDAHDISSGTVGVSTWAGTWRGERAQLRTIVDTLATRKLPALWLSATITEPVNVPCTIDIIVRPAGPNTFSNFDNLQFTLPPVPGLPEEAVARTDKEIAAEALPMGAIASQAALFANPRVKELLITPKGVRIVMLNAEADRARYGVMRQADFGAASALDATLMDRLLARAAAIRMAINVASKAAA